MKVVSWNCKGLGSLIKVDAIRYILKSKRPNILLIQETKMEKQEVMALSYLFWKKYHGKSISSRGASGGITTFCNSNNYTIKSMKENNQWVITELQSKDKQYSICVCNVYDPTHYMDRMVFWEALNLLSEYFHGKHSVFVGTSTLPNCIWRRGEA